MADPVVDPLELIRNAKLPEGTVQLCMRLDLVAQHEQLLRRLARQEAATLVNDSLAGNPVAIELAEQIIALEDEMQAAMVTFRLAGLPRTDWAALAAKHPPRREDGKIVDADVAGVNAETFPQAMLRACLVYPELADDNFALLLSRITDKQYEELTNEAYFLNRGTVSVPFSRAASRIHQASANESERQEPSASASNASKAGNPPKSRSTSTAKTGA